MKNNNVQDYVNAVADTVESKLDRNLFVVERCLTSVKVERHGIDGYIQHRYVSGNFSQDPLWSLYLRGECILSGIDDIERAFYYQKVLTEKYTAVLDHFGFTALQKASSAFGECLPDNWESLSDTIQDEVLSVIKSVQFEDMSNSQYFELIDTHADLFRVHAREMLRIIISDLASTFKPAAVIGLKDQDNLNNWYIERSGAQCPVCHSYTLNAGNFESDGCSGYFVVSCLNCESEWEEVLKVDSISSLKIKPGFIIGEDVFWNDPDQGICSGNYKIKKIVSSDIAKITNGTGSEFEVYFSELDAALNSNNLESGEK